MNDVNKSSFQFLGKHYHTQLYLNSVCRKLIRTVRFKKKTNVKQTQHFILQYFKISKLLCVVTVYF